MCRSASRTAHIAATIIILIYVGASRAKHYLDIVYVGDNQSLGEMVEQISDKKYPTPFIGIARSLNVKPISN